MNPKLKLLFADLELQRQQLIDKVKQSPDSFNKKPTPDKWSVNEILAHLVAAENLSVQYILKKKQGIDGAGNTGLIEEIKMNLLTLSQRLPLKFTAPKPVVSATSAYSSLDELIQDWDSTRENLKRILEQIKDDQLKKKIYKHVILGKLNIIHALKFLGEHMNHHLPQINRLLK